MAICALSVKILTVPLNSATPIAIGDHFPRFGPFSVSMRRNGNISTPNPLLYSRSQQCLDRLPQCNHQCGVDTIVLDFDRLSLFRTTAHIVRVPFRKKCKFEVFCPYNLAFSLSN